MKALFHHLVLMSLALLPVRAQAGFVFNDFGPNNSFNPINGYVTAGANAGPITVAAQFTAADSGGLSTIRLALGQVGGTNAYTVSLLTDDGETPGTTVLESFTLTNRPEYGVPYTPAILTSSLHPYLASGTKYWIEIKSGAPDTTGTWNFNSVGAIGLVLQTGNEGVRFTAPAFSVEVVPEPSSLAMAGLAGLVGAYVLLRRP